jgi:hypothetical protein
MAHMRSHLSSAPPYSFSDRGQEVQIIDLTNLKATWTRNAQRGPRPSEPALACAQDGEMSSICHSETPETGTLSYTKAKTIQSETMG